MSGTIFVRERRKVEDGEKKPRFRVVGVSDTNTKIFTKHLRKVEIEQIAETIGASVVYLSSGKGKREGTTNKAG